MLRTILNPILSVVPANSKPNKCLKVIVDTGNIATYAFYMFEKKKQHKNICLSFVFHMFRTTMKTYETYTFDKQK